jgi:hypothetical protein
VERARLDDPVLADERDRAALRVVGERLDHVAREVEAVWDLPARVGERRIERELEGRERELVRSSSATADAKLSQSSPIIDAIVPRA